MTTCETDVSGIGRGCPAGGRQSGNGPRRRRSETWGGIVRTGRGPGGGCLPQCDRPCQYDSQASLLLRWSRQCAAEHVWAMRRRFRARLFSARTMPLLDRPHYEPCRQGCARLRMLLARHAPGCHWFTAIRRVASDLSQMAPILRHKSARYWSRWPESVGSGWAIVQYSLFAGSARFFRIQPHVPSVLTGFPARVCTFPRGAPTPGRLQGR